MSYATLEEAIPEIRSVVAKTRADNSIPGISVGVVAEGGLTWSEGFGTTRIGEDAPADERTIYRVASITKTFTGTAIVQLAQAGKCRLDDPLVLYVPEFTGVLNPFGPLEAVTLRRLLTHRSGLATEAPFDYWDKFDFVDRDTMLATLPEVEIAIRPDSASKYSNLGFALLGEVVSRLSGMLWADYVTERLLRPLGMESSAFEVTGDIEPRFATGYIPSRHADLPEPAGNPPLNGLSPAGQLYTTVEDLAKWLSYQMWPENGPELLAPEWLTEMHRVQYVSDDWSEGQCLAWRARRSGGRTYFEHGGSVPGYRTVVMFDKANGNGVVFLTNLGGHGAPEETAPKILDVLAGVRSNAVKSPDFSEVLEEYMPLLGTYAAYEQSMASVEWRDGVLKLVSRDSRARLYHAPCVLVPTDEALVFKPDRGRGAGDPAKFVIGNDGRAERFSLGGFVYRRV